MSAIRSELAAIVFFVLVGWVALWPMRERLGATLYHLAALPVGLLSAPFAGAAATVVKRPLDVASAALGALLLIVTMWILQFAAVDRRTAGQSRVGLRSFAVAAGTGGLLAFVFAAARITMANNDSASNFWPLGVRLSRGGAFTIRLIANRSPLLPSMNAIHKALGSDWAYAIYPMLGVVLLFWLVATLLKGPLAGSTRKTRLLVAATAAAFLVTEPSFIVHSLLAHTHMVTAVYLLISLTCIWMAARLQADSESVDHGNAFLILAGISAGGIALTRPDGLAYMFVPVAAAIAALTVSTMRWRSVAAFFGGVLLVNLVPYGTALIRFGLWHSEKLTGRTTFLILLLLGFSVLGPWILEIAERFLPVRVRGERFLGIMVAVACVMMVAVLALKWEVARSALANARINLFQGPGGYLYLWYAVVVLVAISLVAGDALRPGTWTRPAFLGIALFFVIAALVHGTTHAGRIGWGDSLTRVVFHAVPLVIWYVAAVVTRILRSSEAAA